ncbi:hypothetical protein PO909_004974 [Leuciscus waleckii]
MSRILGSFGLTRFEERRYIGRVLSRLLGPFPRAHGCGKKHKKLISKSKVALYFPHRQRDLENMSAPVSEE